MLTLNLLKLEWEHLDNFEYTGQKICYTKLSILGDRYFCRQFTVSLNKSIWQFAFSCQCLRIIKIIYELFVESDKSAKSASENSTIKESENEKPENQNK